ncbi:Uncharacterised protein [Mycobacterium tuberculosis]|nr:Uncharacterised protein [Mycobacterium tuberculosis]COY41266.1 Uncharacterised protein [Mycobacterium tuberculosis]
MPSTPAATALVIARTVFSGKSRVPARCATIIGSSVWPSGKASATPQVPPKAITSATAPNIAVFTIGPLQAFPTVETCAMRGAQYRTVPLRANHDDLPAPAAIK